MIHWTGCLWKSKESFMSSVAPFSFFRLVYLLLCVVYYCMINR